jgi:hypothetical protein
VRVVIKTAICVFILVTACIASAQLHKAGYCIAKGKVFSDKEKIERAVTYVITKYYIGISIDRPKWGSKIYKTEKSFKDEQEFISQNPECCRILKRGFSVRNATYDPAQWIGRVAPPNFWDWVWGDTYDFVKIKYPATYVDDSGSTQATLINEYYSVDNCRWVLDTALGFDPPDESWR